MDITEIEVIAEIEWKDEDNLPEWVDDEVYNVLYPTSRVIEGVRMFPFITICGKEIALKDAEDYFFQNLLKRIKSVGKQLLCEKGEEMDKTAFPELDTNTILIVNACKQVVGSYDDYGNETMTTLTTVAEACERLNCVLEQIKKE